MQHPNLKLHCPPSPSECPCVPLSLDNFLFQQYLKKNPYSNDFRKTFKLFCLLGSVHVHTYNFVHRDYTKFRSNYTYWTYDVLKSKNQNHR